MSSNTPYVPFSQRNGYAEVPPQLQLGEVSEELRRLVYYCVDLEMEREARYGYDVYFLSTWERLTKDIHVVFLGRSASSYSDDVSKWRGSIAGFINELPFMKLFDFLEFIIRNRNCSAELKRDLSDAFLQARTAYRIVDDQIVAIGSEQQAEVFQVALAATATVGAGAARAHLIGAGSALRSGDWAGSVRESIHAVEAMARKVAPEGDTLGKALAALEGNHNLHGGLKQVFRSLYGWTSDEEGVRHALVFNDEANVDETDALFMLGACASFVSYLIARNQGR